MIPAWFSIYLFFVGTLVIINAHFVFYRINYVKSLVYLTLYQLVYFSVIMGFDIISDMYFSGLLKSPVDTLTVPLVTLSTLFLGLLTFESIVTEGAKKSFNVFVLNTLCFLIFTFSLKWVLEGTYFYIFYAVVVVAAKAPIYSRAIRFIRSK
ncbi:MAG: hypothetical protein BM556_11400 [Bacteriovorax sp. MedPE-SWde]|nr:MAG: hypothetical protein BM556_11400 [Bacteriovorax sp. MedPE-SWde]